MILVQGALGSMPWYSIGFFVMWLQLSGRTHHASALIRLAFDVGTTIGTVGGGVLNDVAARRSPDHGRVVVAQARRRLCHAATAVPPLLTRSCLVHRCPSAQGSLCSSLSCC